MEQRLGQIGSHTPAVWFMLGLLLCLSVACATVPKIGVRGDYKKSRLATSALVPFFALSQFSLSKEALQERLDWAESTALQWLRERDVDVVPPRKTRQSLQAVSRWGPFDHNGIFRSDLSRSFENSDDEKNATQTERIQELWSKEYLPDRYILLGEILYHTTGTCETEADDYTKRANVVVAPKAPKKLPRPCVVTHFQARLVDAKTGSTVWYNRRMRELHVPALNESWTRKNVRGVVIETLGGSDGLTKLINP